MVAMVITMVVATISQLVNVYETDLSQVPVHTCYSSDEFLTVCAPAWEQGYPWGN